MINFNYSAKADFASANKDELFLKYKILFIQKREKCPEFCCKKMSGNARAPLSWKEKPVSGEALREGMHQKRSRLPGTLASLGPGRKDCNAFLDSSNSKKVPSDCIMQSRASKLQGSICGESLTSVSIPCSNPVTL